MASCKDVSDFLGQVRSRAVTSVLPDPLAQRLRDLQLVQFFTADQYRGLAAEVAALAADQAALGQESAERAQAAAEVHRDYDRTHSILFRLQGKAKEAEELDAEAKAQAELRAIDADFVQKTAAFNELLGKRSLYDNLTAYGDGYVGLTTVGAVALRDLTVRLYRYADVDFDTYFGQTQRIDQELETLAAGAQGYFTGLSGALPGADRAYLWAIGVGLTKGQPDPTVGGPRYVEAFGATAPLSPNAENRLMASEILVALPPPLASQMPLLTDLVQGVRKLGVPPASALGVASIVLFGRRADGSFATENLRSYLGVTRSYESAALLGIDNAPVDQISTKFQQLRTLFSGWGYSYSEDTELSSAYLAVSEYEPDQISSKLAILARGLSAYLQYPLVAAAVLASVANLEANETLNLVEKAYGTIGRRASGLSPAELICVAVRMVHGIRNELVGSLDATATVAPTAAAPRVGYYPRPIFLPIVIVHGGYYATYGGIGGVHPGHVHGMPSGFGGAGVG